MTRRLTYSQTRWYQLQECIELGVTSVKTWSTPEWVYRCAVHVASAVQQVKMGTSQQTTERVMTVSMKRAKAVLNFLCRLSPSVHATRRVAK